MPRETGRRAGLSHRQVLDTAVQLVQQHGLDGLTMRALATQLDVVPNALYRWFPSKAALLDALVDDALSGVEIPADTTDSSAAVRNLLLDTFDSLVARPDLAPLYLDRRTSPGPASSALRDRLAQLLLYGGASDAVASAAASVLLVYCIGFAAVVQQTGGETGLLHKPNLGSPRDTYAAGVDWLVIGIGTGR